MTLIAETENATMMALNAKTENVTLSVNLGGDDGSEHWNRECDSDGSERQNWKRDEDGSESRNRECDSDGSERQNWKRDEDDSEH